MSRVSPQHDPAAFPPARGGPPAPAPAPAPIGGNQLSERVSNRGAVLAPPPRTPPPDGWGELEPALAAGAGRVSGEPAPAILESLDLAKRQAALIAQAAYTDDDRQRVIVTEDPPWCWICSLLITTGDGRRCLGSGWVAGPRLIVTAGHCVHTRLGGWARRIEVLVGRNEGARLSAHLSSDLHSVWGWTERKDWEYDYGAVILPEPIRVKGSFRYQALPDNRLNTLLYAHVAGYPDDRPPPGTLWGSSRSLSPVLPRSIPYSVSTFNGQSGGPVFYKDGSDRCAVGIHTYGGPQANCATRITQEVYNNIAAWLQLTR
jgi:glutamyl endopeptidase